MKIALFAPLSVIAGALTFAMISAVPAPVDAADACKQTKFETEMVKNACTKGGQKEAKEVMKAFMKDKKLKSCNQCHTKLAPAYPLKPDGLAQFQKLGGK